MLNPRWMIRVRKVGLTRLSMDFLLKDFNILVFLFKLENTRVRGPWLTKRFPRVDYCSVGKKKK